MARSVLQKAAVEPAEIAGFLKNETMKSLAAQSDATP